MKTTLLASPLEQKTRFRIQIKHAVAIGPGKADVLQCIAETGSIAEAGRRLGMSYQTVWSLVRSMNRDFVGPLVSKQRGGAAGGGAALTPLGEQVLALYRDIEARAQAAVAPQIEQLLQLIRTEPDTTGPQAG
ncbi:MAG: winged helix-turn-helix domain-containing protein [Hylemonella sp.]